MRVQISGGSSELCIDFPHVDGSVQTSLKHLIVVHLSLWFLSMFPGLYQG